MKGSEVQESVDWSRLRIAVVGGDEREREIARLAAAAGAKVRAFGFPWPEGGIEGVEKSDSARDALEGAHFALFPIPGMGVDGSLFATESILPDGDLLSVMNNGAHIILGTAGEALKQAAESLGLGLHEYESDNELMLLRMPAIVEGALQLAIENTDRTLHRSKVCVVGYGNIGAMLTRTLVLLGANVTLAARIAEARADALNAGAEAVHTDELESLAPQLDILFSTVPARIVVPAILDKLPRHALVMDLAAPPGGVDLDYAKQIGLKTVWARGLGRRAPVTVGASQWKGISERIAAILKKT